MTPIFKNLRIVLFAATLGTSCFGIVHAQQVVKDPKVNSSATGSSYTFQQHCRAKYRHWQSWGGLG